MKKPLIIFTILLWIASGAGADTVILKSGDRFQTQKAWEEKGKVKFYMQGLVVSVPLSDVSGIVSEETGAVKQFTLKQQDMAAITPKPAPAAPTNKPTATAPASPGLPERKPSPSAQEQKAPALPERQPSPPSQSRQYDANAGRNDKIDFRGLQWGMAPNEINGLKKKGTEAIYGGIDEYYHPEDPLTIGRADLEGVVYGFWNNRLYTITMWTIGRKGYERLRSEAFSRYGQGLKKNPDNERYIWFGNTTDKLLEYDSETNSGILWMRSHELDRQVKQLYGRQP